MNRPDARLLQVTLTGTRLTSGGDDDLRARLQTRFKLTPKQSAAMLKGRRRVIKRGVDPASAEKLVTVLRELGLEAVAEDLTPPASPPGTEAQVSRQPADGDVSTPASAPQTARPAAQGAPQPVAQAATQPVIRPLTQSFTQASKAPLDALNALASQSLPNPRTSFAYMAGLLLVTLLCVALPAAYVGLTGGIAYGWFWYLTHIHHHLPHNAKLVVLMYAVPGLAGAVLVLFLIRPLFAARPRPPQALKLDPEKEAAFVSGVHALCRAIGVSPPIEIHLNWDANASVHFRNRWLSLVTGHKVLTIGLSLVGGLSARQFVGVLAHEFGHFAQRFGMTCTFTVNSVNAWLEHCAYGEDALDRKLREWTDAAAEQEHWFSGLINLSIAATWIAIALIRRVMAGLFLISLRLSRYMSRQMEFDADRYEALLAGSDTFRTTARSLRALNHAFAEVNHANIEAWQEHRLLANLPDAVAARAREFDAARLAKIESEMGEETTTRFWDSHPPDVARIENAEKLRSPGIYHEESPATALFRDFAGWSQQATRLFYAEQGVQFAPEQLRSREEILGSAQHRSQKREQINRFFNGQFQEWPLLQLQVPEAADAARPGWQQCIDQIRARSPEVARHWSSAFQAHEQRPLLRAAVTLGASSREIGLPGAERTSEALGVELGNIAGHRLPFDKPLAEAFVLYALRFQHAIDSMSGSEREQATRLRDTLAAVGAMERDAASLAELAGAMRICSSIAESNGGELPPRFRELEAKFGDCASQLLERTSRIPQTVMEGGTVGAYLRACCRDLPMAGPRAEAAAVARASRPMPAALHRLYLLALGELVSLCEVAEKARGIRPIRLVA